MQDEISRFEEICMQQKDERIKIADLGEPYNDRLIVESFLKGTSLPQEATSLLRAKLMEREPFREKLVAQLARKRGITPEQMWDEIVLGRATKLTRDEYIELEAARAIQEQNR